MKTLCHIFCLCILLASSIITTSANTIIDGVIYGRYRISGDLYTGNIVGLEDKTIFSVRLKSWITLNNKSLSVTIVYKNAFMGCPNLSSVTLPSSITTIQEKAFFGCSSLQSITIPKGVKAIDTCTFYGCYNLATVSLPKGLNRIEEGAFCLCSTLSSINLGDCSLKKIGKNAFMYCDMLKEVSLPPSLTDIGSSAFQGCKGLTSVVLPPNLSALGSNAFADCSKISAVTFQNQTVRVSIRDSAFAGCTGLKSIQMPPTLIYIGKRSFKNCASLLTADIPGETASIGECAFQDCRSLGKVVIPGFVETIGDSAFCGCVALDSVTSLADVPPAMGKDAFRDVSPACVLMVPMGRTQAYRAAGWSEEVFRGGIREIGAPAGISTIKVKPSDTRYYDLQGRPVTRLEKGRIYIHDGRKVVK